MHEIIQIINLSDALVLFFILVLQDDSPAERRFAVLGEGELFEDPDFPASTSSLSYTQPDSEQLMDIVWKRPKVTSILTDLFYLLAFFLSLLHDCSSLSQDICENPCLFVDGASRSDVKQGALGDCWLLSACSALAMRADLTEKARNTDSYLKQEKAMQFDFIKIVNN